MKHTIFKYTVIGITTGVIVPIKKENRKAIQTKGKSVKRKTTRRKHKGNIGEGN